MTQRTHLHIDVVFPFDQIWHTEIYNSLLEWNALLQDIRAVGHESLHTWQNSANADDINCINVRGSISLNPIEKLEGETIRIQCDSSFMVT